MNVCVECSFVRKVDGDAYPYYRCTNPQAILDTRRDPITGDIGFFYKENATSELDQYTKDPPSSVPCEDVRLNKYRMICPHYNDAARQAIFDKVMYDGHTSQDSSVLDGSKAGS